MNPKKIAAAVVINAALIGGLVALPVIGSAQAHPNDGIYGYGYGYMPGWGYGDQNHEHSGPPGLQQGAGNQGHKAESEAEQAVFETGVGQEDSQGQHQEVVDTPVQGQKESNKENKNGASQGNGKGNSSNSIGSNSSSSNSNGRGKAKGHD